MRFSGKTALVMGGNGGIGLAIARILVSEGARVVITGRNEEKLKAAAEELGEPSLAVAVDVDDPQAISSLFSKIATHFGRLDLVFANAGIAQPTPLGKTTFESFNKILITNVTSVFMTVQEALPFMEAGGAVILTGSVMRELGAPGLAAYSASKAAITGMAKVFAAELVQRRIRVNTVIPGATRTSIWTRNAGPGASIEATEDAMSSRIPLERFATAEEVAAAMAFLASKDAEGITAAEIIVDGGTTGAPWGAPAFHA